MGKIERERKKRRLCQGLNWAWSTEVELIVKEGKNQWFSRGSHPGPWPIQLGIAGA